jgi:hypothetical protein
MRSGVGLYEKRVVWLILCCRSAGGMRTGRRGGDGRGLNGNLWPRTCRMRSWIDCGILMRNGVHLRKTSAYETHMHARSLRE